MTSSWNEIPTHTFWDPTPLLGTDDLMALDNVSRPVRNVVTARALGLPRERPGIITSFSVGKARIQRFVSSEEGDLPPFKFTRQRTLSGILQPWVLDGGASSEGVSAGTVRRDVMQQKLTARKGGRIGTNGKGVIALRFDDAPAEFLDVILPQLTARNIPFTRVSTTESVGATAIDPDVFASMQTCAIECGGEVWAHGRDHLDASGETAITVEIVGALADLRGKLPRLPIDCFAPPGGFSMSYDGHMPSSTVESWADTFAGRLIMSNYALASGYFKDSFYRPLDGVLRDGQNHYSVDSYGLSRATALIDRARDWKMGVVMMWHSNKIGGSGNMTLADFTAVLDYLVAERDAGNLLVLTKSGLAVADVSSSYRDNVLVASSGNPFTQTLFHPQYRQNIPGSTRELTATVTGAAATTVTSVVGESTKTHTIPFSGTLQLRHVATIPMDVTALTVSIDANTTGAKLLAV